MAAERRAGYDCVFSAPKSVSILAFIAGDERLVFAHDRAVDSASAELERFACQQAGQGLNKKYLRTAKIAGARFRHGENRELDPQLHTHEFVFNVTRSADGRLVALEASEIFARTRYLTEVYRNSLASEVRSLGYALTKTRNGFEIDGVSRELIERFSKRSKERDTAIAAREQAVGRKLTNNEVTVLVRKTRAKKMTELSPLEIRRRQIEQMGDNELKALRKLCASAYRPSSHTSISVRSMIEMAKEHVFERKSVVYEHELIAEAIRTSYGEHQLSNIQAAVADAKHGLVLADGRVSTLEAIEHERALIAAVNAGIGRCSALGRMPAANSLSADQRQAVQKILDCRDTVQVLRGKAGSGKTTSLAQIIEGSAAVGNESICFAPSSRAVNVLCRDGADQNARGFSLAGHSLADASTVQRLLADLGAQANLNGKIIVIDEYGLLSTRDLKQIIDLVHNRGCRLLLVGDSAQHTSVEAGSAARLIEKETRVSISEIGDIRRQGQNAGYLRAAKALAAGNLRKGLSVLNEIGAIVEIKDGQHRRAAMVDEWVAAAFSRNSRTGPEMRGLMVAPTWGEIDSLNRLARERLRAKGILKGEDREVRSLWRQDWTRAQLKDGRNYEDGYVLVARKRGKHFEKGDELVVLQKEGDRLLVRNQRGKELSVSPKQSGTAWTVCEARSMLLATGDEIRLRAIGQVRVKGGAARRVPNGALLRVAGITADGQVRLADGAILLSRELVHGYATTSQAAQGVTVDSVYMTDPLSREGLYVSATRGRETIRIFTADKPALLATARLQSENRISATEFARQAGIARDNQLFSMPRQTAQHLKGLMADGFERGRSFSILCLNILRPWWVGRRATAIHTERHQQLESSHVKKC
jgi:conjugative relaxase-like TrwC/TraI family protein